jgi:hypothetical protein
MGPLTPHSSYRVLSTIPTMQHEYPLPGPTNSPSFVIAKCQNNDIKPDVTIAITLGQPVDDAEPPV